MVADPLKAGKKIRPYKAGFNRALPAFQTDDMAVSEGGSEVVHHLLQRLHVIGKRHVFLHESPLGQRQRFLHCQAKDVQLGFGRAGKFNSLFPQFLRRLYDVYSVVGYPLQIPDRFQQFGDGCAVPVRNLILAQAGKIGSEDVFIMVGLFLDIPHLLCNLGRKTVDRLDTQPKAPDRLCCHFGSETAALVQRNARRSQESFVQFHRLFGALSVGNHLIRQLFQQGRGRQQQYRTKDIECRMADRNAKVGRRLRKNCGLQDGRQDAERRKPDDCADHVKGQVNERRTLSVFIGAERRQHGGHAGTDILSHDDRDRRTVRDCPRRRQRLKNTDGSGT